MVIGIILVGTGHIAEEHARAIKRVKGAKLVGVFSNDKARAGDFARRHNTKGYWDINEALKNPEVNVLDIANQNYLHGDFALLGINAGKHLIIEKPIDISVAKARKVIEESKKKGVFITVISQYRFGKGFIKLKKMIDNGSLGKLIMGVVVLGKHRDEKDYCSGGGWKKNKKGAGGGVLIMNAVHYINILRWLFGEVKEVKGGLATLTHDIEVEDTGAVLLKFHNNAIAAISATTSLKFNIPDRVEVYGSRCSVVVENGRIVKKSAGNRIYSGLLTVLMLFNTAKQGNIKEQIDNFINFLNDKGKLEITGEDGLRDLEILDRIYK